MAAKIMKVFFDTEFTGLHQLTTLISIGLVAETGTSFYAEFTDYEREKVINWTNKDKVLSSLALDKLKENEFYTSEDDREWYYKGPAGFIRIALRFWLKQFEGVEMWSDVMAYDWVLFRELFKGDVPDNVYYIPFDLVTLMKAKGVDPDINRESFAFGEYLQEMKDQKHNALWDAKVIKACYERLSNG